MREHHLERAGKGKWWKIIVTVPLSFRFGCYCSTSVWRLLHSNPDLFSGGKKHHQLGHARLVNRQCFEQVIDPWPIFDTVPGVNAQLLGIYIIIGSNRFNRSKHCYLAIQWFLQEPFFRASKTAPGPADQHFLCIGEAKTRHLKQGRFLLRMQLGLLVC